MSWLSILKMKKFSFIGAWPAKHAKQNFLSEDFRSVHSIFLIVQNVLELNIITDFALIMD